MFGNLPACQCEDCQLVHQVGRIFPLRRCAVCKREGRPYVCANPDCSKPPSGKRARKPRRGLAIPLLTPSPVPVPKGT